MTGRDPLLTNWYLKDGTRILETTELDRLLAKARLAEVRESLWPEESREFWSPKRTREQQKAFWSGRKNVTIRDARHRSPVRRWHRLPELRSDEPS